MPLGVTFPEMVTVPPCATDNDVVVTRDAAEAAGPARPSARAVNATAPDARSPTIRADVRAVIAERPMFVCLHLMTGV